MTAAFSRLRERGGLRDSDKRNSSAPFLFGRVSWLGCERERPTHRVFMAGCGMSLMRAPDPIAGLICHNSNQFRTKFDSYMLAVGCEWGTRASFGGEGKRPGRKGHTRYPFRRGGYAGNGRRRVCKMNGWGGGCHCRVAGVKYANRGVITKGPARTPSAISRPPRCY
jgi:hypothetical protein